MLCIMFLFGGAWLTFCFRIRFDVYSTCLKAKYIYIYYLHLLGCGCYVPDFISVVGGLGGAVRDNVKTKRKRRCMTVGVFQCMLLTLRAAMLVDAVLTVRFSVGRCTLRGAPYAPPGFGSPSSPRGKLRTQIILSFKVVGS